MSRASHHEQLTFLISCVRNSKYGKVDFDEVVRECGIGSRASASKRYGRLQRAHGAQQKRPSVSQSGTSAQLKPASRKAIAQAAEAKRRQIEGDTSADPAADDNDVGDVWPKPESDDEPRIKQEPSAPAQCPPSYWSARSPNLTSLTQPTSYSHPQSTSTNALKREQLHSTPCQDYWQSIARSYPSQHCIPIKKSTSPDAIIKQEVMNDQEDAEDDLMTDAQPLTDSSEVREHNLAQYLISEPFAPPMRLDHLCSASHNARPEPTTAMTSISQLTAADLNDQYSNLSTLARVQEVIVIAD